MKKKFFLALFSLLTLSYSILSHLLFQQRDQWYDQQTKKYITQLQQDKKHHREPASTNVEYSLDISLYKDYFSNNSFQKHFQYELGVQIKTSTHKKT